MVKTIDVNDFRKAFRDMDRGEQFTYEGLGVLFYHLEECEDIYTEPMELDVIALCCDYTEYKDFAEFKNNYEDYDTIEELKDNQCVLPISEKSCGEGFILANF
mgnify:FL=1